MSEDQTIGHELAKLPCTTKIRQRLLSKHIDDGKCQEQEYEYTVCFTDYLDIMPSSGAHEIPALGATILFVVVNALIKLRIECPTVLN